MQMGGKMKNKTLLIWKGEQRAKVSRKSTHKEGLFQACPLQSGVNVSMHLVQVRQFFKLKTRSGGKDRPS